MGFPPPLEPDDEFEAALDWNPASDESDSSRDDLVPARPVSTPGDPWVGAAEDQEWTSLGEAGDLVPTTDLQRDDEVPQPDRSEVVDTDALLVARVVEKLEQRLAYVEHGIPGLEILEQRLDRLEHGVPGFEVLEQRLDRLEHVASGLTDLGARLERLETALPEFRALNRNLDAVLHRVDYLEKLSSDGRAVARAKYRELADLQLALARVESELRSLRQATSNRDAPRDDVSDPPDQPKRREPNSIVFRMRTGG